MKKRVVFPILLIFLLLPLSACVRESPEPLIEIPPQTEERTLVHTAKYGVLTVWQYSDQTAAIADSEPSPGAKTLDIPADFDGYTVTEIADGAFASSAFSEIRLPDSVTAIGKGAFQKSLLERITLPASLTQLGDEAFDNCFHLKEVVFSSPLSSVPTSCFFSCRSLVSVTLPEGLCTIGEEAFADCTALRSVTLPASLREIGPYAFWNCKSLAFSETLPQNLNTVGENAFAGTPYEQDPAFARTSAKEGVL